MGNSRVISLFMPTWRRTVAYQARWLMMRDCDVIAYCGAEGIIVKFMLLFVSANKTNRRNVYFEINVNKIYRAETYTSFTNLCNSLFKGVYFYTSISICCLHILIFF